MKRAVGRYGRSLKPRAPCEACGISCPITHKNPPHLCASCRYARNHGGPVDQAIAWRKAGLGDLAVEGDW